MAWDGFERRVDNYGERIAILETNYANLTSAKQEILDKVDELANSLRDYRGFIGGVAWVVGTLVAGALFIWELFSDYFKGHWH